MLKIPKKVRELPWPEPYTGPENIHFRVTVRQPVADGHRLLVVDFTMNETRRNAMRWTSATGQDLRLVCDKKAHQAAVLERGTRAFRRRPLKDAMSRCFGARPDWCYPEIGAAEEAALCRWLGCRDATANHRLPELARWAAEAVAAEELKEKQRRGEILDGDVAQCPEELPQGLVDYIRRVMLPEDNVLLYKKGGLRGTCFLCRQSVRAADAGERFSQGRVRACPRCGREVRHVLAGGALYEAETVENVVTLQRGREAGMLFLREWRLERDVTAQWEDIPKYLNETARWMLQGGCAAKWQRERKVAVGMMRTERVSCHDWERVRSVTEAYDGGFYFYLPENWREIVAGTPLHYCPLEDFGRGRRCEISALRMAVDWPRYPAVEKLYKAGYVRLVQERIRGTKAHRDAVNWRADSLDRALRFPRRLLRLYTPEEWSLEQVLVVNRLWDMVRRGTLREQEIGAFLDSGLKWEHVSNALGHAPVGRIAAWLESQRTMARQRFDEEERRRIAASKNGASGRRTYRDTTAETYRDYLADCVKLGLELDDRAVLLPKDLETAHRRTIAAVKHKANEAERAAFRAQAEKLEKWRWASGGLLIRPAADADELIGEGAALHHCVGGYAHRMASGETAIFFVRRRSRPEEPYYTLELRNGTVIQCRTRHNAGYEQDREVYDFVAAWLRDVVQKKRKNSRKKEDAA